jgi:hypothetical protein
VPSAIENTINPNPEVVVDTVGSKVGVEVAVSVGAGELVSSVSLGAGVVSKTVGVAVSAEHELSRKAVMNKEVTIAWIVW